MKNNKYWKKIAAILITSALVMQGTTIFAADAAATEETQAEASYEEAEPAPQAEEQEADEPTEVPEEIPEEAPAEVPEETPAEIPEEVPEEIPAEIPDAGEAPAETPEEGEVPAETPEEGEAPAETPEEDEAPAETPEEGETPAELPDEEVPAEETYKTEFRFENEEVVITARASEEAKLPENTEMKAVKLAEGTPAYEEAKKASAEKLGTSEDATYTFYDVTFETEGQKLDPVKGTVAIKMVFKTVLVDETAEKQSVVHIEDTEAGKVVNDVTEAGNAGSNMSSVDFAF